MKKFCFSRFFRAMLAVLMLLGFSAVTVGNASAQLISENFEGTFPPAGWSVTNDQPGTGPVFWHRSDQLPNYAALQSSGLTAYVESYPAYCGYAYDTSLITPPFSTMGLTNVSVRFDYQYWVYSSEFLALDYRIGAGPWIHLENLPSIGGYVVESHVVDISVTRGNPSVQLRWRYYNLSTGCDWWANIDNVEIGHDVGIPTLNEWGMIIFMVLAGLGSVYYLRRRRSAKS
jgi:hypothetical protein